MKSNSSTPLNEILKELESVIVDNAIKIIEDPDFKFEPIHDKAHDKTVKALENLIAESVTKARIEQTQRCDRQTRLLDWQMSKEWFAKELKALSHGDRDER